VKALLIVAGIGLLTTTIAGSLAAVADARADKWEAAERKSQACFKAARQKTMAGADPSKLCPEHVAVHWAVSLRAQACDQALDPKAENLFGIKTACSTPVKTLWAARDVAQANLRHTRAELKTERDGRKAAIARAAADATTQAQRKTRRVEIDQAAPRDPAGRVVCDADCVRKRFER
jgi:hypothetical protein